MARINIEDSIYKDHRFIGLAMKLGGNIHTAIGALVMAWSLAQRWYLQPCQWIPLEEWEKNLIPKEIIEVGLAEIVDGHVRIKGAHEQFRWLRQCSDAGRKGGSARPKIDQSTAKRSLRVDKPLPLSLSLKDKEKKNTPPSAVLDFDQIYKTYPRKTGKSKGLKICAKTVTSEEDLKKLAAAVARFVEYHRRVKTEPQFIPHFSTFMASWTDWLDEDAGKSELFTGPKIKKIEESA